jgi:hypothetical protein
MKVLLNAGFPVFVIFGKELSPFRGRHHSAIVDCMCSIVKKMTVKAMIYGKLLLNLKLNIQL